MAPRNRMNVTLAGDEIDVLRWLSAERSMLPAVLASRLIAEGLWRAQQDPAVAEAYYNWRTGRTIEEIVRADVVAALSYPGVPDVLAGRRRAADPEQTRVASFIVTLSRWLEDDRPAADKGACPRLATHKSVHVPNGDVAPALAIAGYADGAPSGGPSRGGAQTTPDKRRLSDIWGRGTPRAGAGGPS